MKSQISDMSVKFEEKINETKAEINKKPNKDEVEAMIGMSLSKIKAPDMEEVNKAITEQTDGLVWFRGLTPQQQPGSYQGGEMMMMKSVFWWRKPEHPEETTDLRQVTDETFSHIRPLPSPGIELGPQRCEAK